MRLTSQTSTVLAITTLSCVCISTPAAVAETIKPGLYAAGRDLAGSAVIGTHQFVVMVPENPNNCSKCKDLGDGTQGIVVGTHNKTRLLVVFFEQSDWQAIKEYTNPKKYTSLWKPDLDAEVHRIDISPLQLDTAITKVLQAVDHYTQYEAKNNHPYPSTAQTLRNDPDLLNSNAWAQSLVEHAFGKGKVVEDFNGKDSGHQNRFDKRYFVP